MPRHCFVRLAPRCPAGFALTRERARVADPLAADIGPEDFSLRDNDLDQAQSRQLFGEHNFVFSGELKHLLGRAKTVAPSPPSL